MRGPLQLALAFANRTVQSRSPPEPEQVLSVETAYERDDPMTPLTSALAFGALAAAVALLVRALLSLFRFRRMELDIPGPPSLPVLGNALDLVGLTEANVFPSLLALWGGRRRTLSRVSILNKLIVFVTAADDIQAVVKRKDLADKAHFYYDLLHAVARYGLFQINGELWRRHRRALQPAFHAELLDRAVEYFAEEARGFARRVVAGREVDVTDETRRAVSRSFLRSSITKNLNADFDAYLVSCMTFIEAFLHSVLDRSLNVFLRPDFIYNRTAAGRRLRAGLEEIERLSSAIIDQVREELDAQPTATTENFIKERRTLVEILMQHGRQPGEYRMSEEEIRDEMKINAGAAIETTASALCLFLKVLSLRPDVQDRLHRELVEVFGRTDRAVRADDLPRLEYTERFVKEAMRVFPPTPFVARQVHRDTELASYKLPAGTTLLLNIFGAHRDPEHWPDPLVFDPDRFLAERSAGRHPCAYLPFSAGARNCIGNKYAMMNMKTFLATVLREWRVDRADDPFTDMHQLPLTFDISLRVLGGTRVVFTRRD